MKKWILLLGFFGVLLAGGACFLFVPNPYLTPFLVSWINRQDWGQFKIKGISLGLNKIYFTDVTYLPRADFEPIQVNAGEIDVSWENMRPHVQQVILKDLEISKTDLVALLEGPSSGGMSTPSLGLENAKIISRDKDFPFVADINGQLNAGQSFAGDVSVKFKDGKVQGKIELDLSKAEIQGKLSDIAVAIEGWEHLPIKGEGSISEEGGQIKTHIWSYGSELKVNTKCAYSLGKEKGQCAIAYKTSNAERVIPPAWIKEYKLQNLSGRLDGNAQLDFNASGIQSLKGKVDFLDANFNHPLSTIEGLSTKLVYVWGHSITFPSQLLDIHIKKANPGVGLTGLNLRLQWDGKDNFLLENASANMGGGTLMTQGVRFQLPIESIRVPLAFKNVPASFFIDRLNLSDLKISGTIEGDVGVAFTQDGYAIQNGSYLKTEDLSGTIQYRPGEEPPETKALSGDEKPMDLIYLALWDFQYSKLELEVEKPLQDGIKATLLLNGKNPKLLNGQAFNLKVNFGGQIKELIENIFRSIKGK